VVPALNEEADIEKTIRELLPFVRQARVPFEIVAVNDGSTMMEAPTRRARSLIGSRVRSPNSKRFITSFAKGLAHRSAKCCARQRLAT
jgi:hypothetical protein